MKKAVEEVKETPHKFMVNCSNGLTLPVLIHTEKGNLINIQYAAPKSVVLCPEITEQMQEWIDKQFLVAVNN